MALCSGCSLPIGMAWEEDALPIPAHPLEYAHRNRDRRIRADLQVIYLTLARHASCSLLFYVQTMRHKDSFRIIRLFVI